MELIKLLRQIEDPRMERCKLYSLESVLGIGLCAMLCGATDFEEMEAFGLSKLDLMKQLFDLPNGIPSHDTFNRVFKLVKPEAFSKVLTDHALSIITELNDKQICIDGKCLRGTNDSGKSGKKGNRCQNIVSAWVSAHRIVIGQQQVATKSNEITAIPKILEQIDLQGAVVSIDAIGCQKEIAAQIADSGGIYVLPVKDNQPTLHMELKKHFEQEIATPDTDKTLDIGHGRIELRTCRVSKDLSNIHVKELWQGLNTIIEVKRQTEFKKTGQKREEQTQYYITNASMAAKQANQFVRNHWGIENGLHWQLDVTFKEDQNMTTDKNAVQNLNTLRKLALQIIQNNNNSKKSKKVQIKSMGWDDKQLLNLFRNIKF
jgi:predicted transposase YbfD/YdcC